MKRVRELFVIWFFICSLVPIGISFVLSTMRQMDHPNCKALNIDRLEPVISTRWFCEVVK